MAACLADRVCCFVACAPTYSIVPMHSDRICVHTNSAPSGSDVQVASAADHVRDACDNVAYNGIIYCARTRRISAALGGAPPASLRLPAIHQDI